VRRACQADLLQATAAGVGRTDRSRDRLKSDRGEPCYATGVPAPRPSRGWRSAEDLLQRGPRQVPEKADRALLKIDADGRAKLPELIGKARDSVLTGSPRWRPQLAVALGLRAAPVAQRADSAFLEWMSAHPTEAYSALHGLWGPEMRSIEWFVDCLPQGPFADRELQRAIVFILMLKPAPQPGQRESRISVVEDELVGTRSPIFEPDLVDPPATRRPANQLGRPSTSDVADSLAENHTVTHLPASDNLRSRIIPIEAHIIEVFRAEPGAEPAEYQRREAALVQRYAAWLAKRGRPAARNEIRLPDQARPLYTDLYDLILEELVEAKASSGRADVRMAIGQLLDYSRYVEHKSLALLTPRPVSGDLEDLLLSQGIVSIYEGSSSSFQRADGSRGAGA